MNTNIKSTPGIAAILLAALASVAGWPAAVRAQTPVPPPTRIAPVPVVPAPAPPVPPLDMPRLSPGPFDSATTDALKLLLEESRARVDASSARMAELAMKFDQERTVIAQSPNRYVWYGGESGAYQVGLSALDGEQWDRAVDMFDRVIRTGKTHVDGAMYWKAYALDRLGRRNDALATLQDMIKAYPASRYLEDAKALEIEVRRNLGQPARPEDHANDELKLLAMTSLMRTDPDRAIPLIEQMLKGHDSPRVKQNALFVLGTSESPRAREVLVQVARGSLNPDLQLKAIRYLATRRTSNTAQLLADIYGSTKDTDVRREIIRYLSVAGGVDQLVGIAKTEPSAELRVDAIRHLGSLKADDQLSQIFYAEKEPEIRGQILRQMMAGGYVERAAEMAKQEADAKVRASAVRSLGGADARKTGDALVQIYKTDKDQAVKKAVISALYAQQNAKALVDLARAESDPVMKKEIVSRLATMKSKEATDYMLELLK